MVYNANPIMGNRHLGRYEILEEIGRGGMATVYRAADRQFEREVAIKVLPRQFTHDPSFLNRFKLEAQTIATLEHAAIVPVYDFGEARDFPYLVMRHMKGGTLNDRLRQGPLSLEEIAPIIDRIAAALDSAHKKGIIHRDLKPTNILFDGEAYAFLSDFGILKLVESTASFTGSTIIGTPAYMSPEQVTGDKQIDSRSDVYALGVILFEMLAGLKPFTAETPTKEMMAHVLQPVPDIQEINKDLPDGVAAIVNKALAKDPDDRYQTAGALAADIDLQLQGGTPTGPLLASGGASRKRLKIALLALAILAICVVYSVGALILADQDGGEDRLSASATAGQEEVAAALTDDMETPTESATPTPSRTAASPSRTPSPTRRTQTPTRAAAASPVSQAALMSPPPSARVRLSSVNVRSGPGTSYLPVAVLRQDDVVEVIARNAQGSWLLVKLPDGDLGWVSITVVELIEPDQPEQVPTAATIPPLPATNTFTPTATRTPTSVPTDTPFVPPTDLPPTRTRTPTRTLTPTSTLEPPPSFTKTPTPAV